MKFLILMVIGSCLELALGACPDCDGISSFYDAVGCTVLCKRKACPTNYSCRKVIQKYKAEKKCIFNGETYDVNVILAQRYPNREGSGMCTYQCIYDSGTDGYYFVDVDCEPSSNEPTTEQCNGMLQIVAHFVLQLNTGITYNPESCQVGIVISFDLPESNCAGSKCCKFMDRVYKRGTVIETSGQTCYCLCPPIMLCL